MDPAKKVLKNHYTNKLTRTELDNNLKAFYAEARNKEGNTVVRC